MVYDNNFKIKFKEKFEKVQKMDSVLNSDQKILTNIESYLFKQLFLLKAEATNINVQFDDSPPQPICSDKISCEAIKLRVYIRQNCVSFDGSQIGVSDLINISVALFFEANDGFLIPDYCTDKLTNLEFKADCYVNNKSDILSILKKPKVEASLKPIPILKQDEAIKMRTFSSKICNRY